MATYLFSSWPFGTYNNDWDLQTAISRQEIKFADYVPLVDKLEQGDVCYFRQYSKGIFAKAKIQKVIYEGRAAMVKLDDLQGLYGEISQDAFFVCSSNQNMRSRIIKLSNRDSDWIERLNERKENHLFGSCDNIPEITLAAKLKVKEEIKRKVLWGQQR